jgi:hypothetical protein
MKTLKFFFAWIFRWSLIWTEDCDGEVRLRRMHHTPFGRYMAASILNRDIILNANGTTSGCSYVRQWTPANAEARKVNSK